MAFKNKVLIAIAIIFLNTSLKGQNKLRSPSNSTFNKKNKTSSNNSSNNCLHYSSKDIISEKIEIIIVGWSASILSVGISVPQIYHAIKTKSVKDISWYFPIIAVMSSSLWGVYGILKDDLPLILCSFTSSGLNSLLIFQKYYYSNYNKREIHN